MKIRWVLASVLLTGACSHTHASHLAATSSPTYSLAPTPTLIPTTKARPVSVRRLQRALAAAGYPVGPIDGREGPRTDQGLCAYRAVAGLSGQRTRTTARTRRSLDHPSKLPVAVTSTRLPATAKKMQRGVVVDQACQTAFLIQKGLLNRVITISSGGHYQFYNAYTHSEDWADSPRGLWHLNWRKSGEVTSNEVQGVMFYPWFFHGGAALHGETDPGAVPPYPASHGCVRMQMPDILYIWHHFKTGDPVLVYGQY